MKFVLYGMMAAGLCTAANADTIQFGGQSYETINWTNVSSATNTASGTAGGIGVTFETVDIMSDSIFANDFSSDSGFDALNFQSGTSGSLSILGGLDGLSSLHFDQTVGSVLMLIGAPNDASGENQFGAAIWNFGEGAELTLIDNEINPGLTLVNGNQVVNEIAGPGTHQSGVIGASGSFDTLNWSQTSGLGIDQMMITFAVMPATIPAPASALALLLPAAAMGRRRR